LFRFYRLALWWTNRVQGLRVGGTAVWAAASLFALSAYFSYGLLAAGSGAGQNERPPAQLASLVPTLAPPPRPEPVAEYLGPELPKSLDSVAEPDPGASDVSATLNVVTGHIPAGGTLGSALRSQGISPQTVDLLNRTMSPLFDFRHARRGDFFALVMKKPAHVLSFEYQRGRSTIYKIQRNELDLLVVSRAEAPLERRVVQIGSVIDSSLFESLTMLGERAELAQEFADIFIWDFDFSTQTRPGDEFRMVVEKFYDDQGLVRYGSILGAQYRASEKQFTALYFEEQDGYGDYYTPLGNSVRRSFLRAPLKYSRISSRYTKSRLHPILKVRRPHEGIDYAAPTGTPIWAVADGVIIHKGWNRGLGRLLKIRHNNGYVSYYGHLSKYAKGMEVGKRVTQREVIGHVGSSGLSTGPHLDYRLQVDGRFVDPLKVRFPNGQPVPVKAMARFEDMREKRLAQLREAQPPLVLEAAM
jgi:murein DD-endopeptidase MepM/ murein hydrolase activator NlpD